MQEEVNEKTVALVIRGGKISAEILKSALLKLERRLEAERRSHRSEVHAARRARKAARQEAAKHVGKKTLSEMLAEGSELSNIEITDQNIRSFEKVARQYQIAYSLKRDQSVKPPKYLVFFRAKDVDVMTAAFREYTGRSLQKSPKVSLRRKLQKMLDREAQHRQRQRTRQKDRGQER